MFFILLHRKHGRWVMQMCIKALLCWETGDTYLHSRIHAWFPNAIHLTKTFNSRVLLTNIYKFCWWMVLSKGLWQINQILIIFPISCSIYIQINSLYNTAQIHCNSYWKKKNILLKTILVNCSQIGLHYLMSLITGTVAHFLLEIGNTKLYFTKWLRRNLDKTDNDDATLDKRPNLKSSEEKFPLMYPKLS